MRPIDGPLPPPARRAREIDRTPLAGSTQAAARDAEARAEAIRAEVEARSNGQAAAPPAPSPDRAVSVSLSAFGPIALEITNQVAEQVHNEILLAIRRHGTNVPAALLALEQAKATLLIVERRRLGLPLS